jgi:hypothetical protein
MTLVESRFRRSRTIMNASQGGVASRQYAHNELCTRNTGSSHRQTYKIHNAIHRLPRPVAVRRCASEVKDPLLDSLTLAGVTLYGTVDIGYAYQSNGAPLSSKYLGGLEYQAFTTTRNFSGSQSTLAESASSSRRWTSGSTYRSAAASARLAESKPALIRCQGNSPMPAQVSRTTAA